jgi:hypothetical protein
MIPFSKDECIIMAEDAIRNSKQIKSSVIKGISYFNDKQIRCELLIANNNGEKVNSTNFFEDCNIRFNFYDDCNCILNAHNENIHPNDPHVHVGRKRIKYPLNSITAASLLACTSNMLKESYDITNNNI